MGTLPKSAKTVKIGDYVLATKYHDGDTGDEFAVGLYDGEHFRGRHFVIDSDGKQFRRNGFRRIKKISRERGQFLIDHFKDMDAGTRSVWWWARCLMKSFD